MSQLPLTDEIVRGSLIERVIRHRRGCAGACVVTRSTSNAGGWAIITS
jgi:hypothetical protein